MSAHGVVFQQCESLSREDCKTIRSSIFGLVKYFLQREVSAKEVYPIVAYLQTERNESLIRELVEMLIHYLENRQAKDQMFLVMYESKRADLLYCLLLNHVLSDQGVSNSPSLKKSILRLITTLLRTNRVSSRHKCRMHLAEAR